MLVDTQHEPPGQLLGVNASALRYYEQRGLVHPSRNTAAAILDSPTHR